MAGDNQQFCLRWNNHQSTLISVFDSLLESGTLVDCTLAAEGQYLKAHKVVLSACSPYLEVLLSQHYEKHPIVILKDVKFQELKSMMDYMYRGEVNITQDQLATFLKAAESLQIKGLSESSGGDDARDVGSTTKRQREDPPPRRPVNPHPQARLPHSSGLTIEPRRSIPHSSEMAPASPMKSREGSTSPVARKRRRRRPSTGDDASNAALSDSQLETSNSCDLPPISNQAQSTPISVPSILATPSASNNQPIESDQPLETDALNRFPNTPGGELMVKTKMEPNTDQLIEPKTEYLEDVNNEDSVEDLTLDDDDEMPGPSHADGSNQSFAQWQMSGDRSTDEVFMAAQEAVGAHRDSQGGMTFRKPLMRFTVKREETDGYAENSKNSNVSSVPSVTVKIEQNDNDDNSTREERMDKSALGPKPRIKKERYGSHRRDTAHCSNSQSVDGSISSSQSIKQEQALEGDDEGNVVGDGWENDVWDDYLKRTPPIKMEFENFDDTQVPMNMVFKEEPSGEGSILETNFASSCSGRKTEIKEEYTSDSSVAERSSIEGLQVKQERGSDVGSEDSSSSKSTACPTMNKIVVSRDSSSPQCLGVENDSTIIRCKICRKKFKSVSNCNTHVVVIHKVKSGKLLKRCVEISPVLNSHKYF